MFYQILKPTLNVKILRLENICCEKTIIYDSKSWTFYSYAFFVLKIILFYLLFYENTDYFRISTRRKKFCATPGTPWQVV